MSLVSNLGNRFRVELVGSAFATAAGTILVFVLARLLDPSGYGLLFLAISVFSVAKIFSNLGIARSAARYVTEYREKDPAQIPHILLRSLVFNVATISVVAVVFFAANRPIAGVIEGPALQSFLLLGTLYIVFSSLSLYARHMAQGFEDIALAATISVLNQGTRLLSAVGLVLLGYGALGALGGFILGSALASAVGLGTLYVRYYRGAERADRMESGLSRQILEYNVPLTITGMTGKLDKNVDTILIGFFLNPVAVSYYTLSKQIIQATMMPARSLGFSISPTYGKQKASQQLDTAARMFETSLSYALLLYVPAATGIFFVASPAVELVFGADYAGAVPVLQVLSVYAVLNAITVLTDQPLDYLGRARERAIAKSVASGSNVLLNVLLIPLVGVVGAAIATVITHSFYVSVKLYLIHSELPLRIRDILLDTSYIITITLSMGVVLHVALPYVSGIASLAGVILLAVATWAVLSVLTGVMDYDMIRRAIA